MLNNRKKIIFAFVVVFLLSTFYFLLSTSIEAAAPLQLRYTFPCAPIGGGACPTEAEVAQSPAAYIARLYQFALMLSGMLAFGMIIFGAIQYIVSAGNTTQQSDARDRITQALWGVALLLGAYLILYTIDPKLVSLTDPNIDIIKVEAPSPKTRAIGIEGSNCVETADCSSGFECRGGKCTITEERKKQQESGKHQWVDFGDYAGRANLCPKEMPYADNYCSGPKPASTYYCCLK